MVVTSGIKAKILPPREMEARATRRIKKFEFGKTVFYQLLRGFKDQGIPDDEKRNLLKFLNEQHERKLCSKKGQVWEP